MKFSISDYIAAGSFLVALFALIKSIFSDRKVKRLDLQLKEIALQQHKMDKEDAMKADIEVEVIETSSKMMDKLRFYNKGQAPASNVSFEIPTNTDDEISFDMTTNYLPYPKLLPYQKFELSYYNGSYKPHHTIVITWDDEFEKGRRKEMVVDM